MADSTDDLIPAGWKKILSRSTDIHYYFNVYTNESQWDLPTSPAKPSQIQASHLLVKHNKSRRSSSWRGQKIVRSKEEARKILEEYKKQIDAGKTTLSELAKNYSDCSSAKRNGDLGLFGRGEMQQPFEDVAFSLKVGEMSAVVETESGFHLILRTL